MTPEALLSIALVVCPLVGAVVAFGLQLHNLRKASLDVEKAKLEVQALRVQLKSELTEREKLQLEIEELRSRSRERSQASRFVHNLSTEEVLKYSDPFSGFQGDRTMVRPSRGRRNFEDTGCMPAPAGDSVDTVPLDDARTPTQNGEETGSSIWLLAAVFLSILYVLAVITYLSRAA